MSGGRIFGAERPAKRTARLCDLVVHIVVGKVQVNFTYLSKIENTKLDFGKFPGEGLILKLKALKADQDELLLLAEKIPDRIRRRVIEQPDAFQKIASLNDEKLDRLLTHLER